MEKKEGKGPQPQFREVFDAVAGSDMDPGVKAAWANIDQALEENPDWFDKSLPKMKEVALLKLPGLSKHFPRKDPFLKGPRDK